MQLLIAHNHILMVYFKVRHYQITQDCSGEAMAIFGKADVKQYSNWPAVCREGNNWDGFLNYLFAMLFIFCFIIGIFLNPFIIAYHAKQKRTFSTILFILVSSIDQFKSLYFPLALIPKLLSPLENDYFISDQSSISWTAHANIFLLPLCDFEMDLLVVLCIARYASIVYPLSSARKRNIFFSTAILLSFLYWMSSPAHDYFMKPLVYVRYLHMVVSIKHVLDEDNVTMPVFYGEGLFQCFFLLLGGIFSFLTIRYLKNSDPASSETSSNNIRRGIIFLITMNLFNVFVLLSLVGHKIGTRVMSSTSWTKFSTGLDFIQFTNLYGTPLIQSAFNSLSFLFICSSFREFVQKLMRKQRIGHSSPSVQIHREQRQE